MALKVALQMDPIAAIDITGDTSFALGLEAQARGAELYYYEPDALSLRDGIVSAPVHALRLADVKGAHFELSPPQVMDLREMDVILMRQDPPF